MLTGIFLMVGVLLAGAVIMYIIARVGENYNDWKDKQKKGNNP